MAERRRKRARAHVTVRADLVAWADDQAEERTCNRNVLLDTALEVLRDIVEGREVVVRLPGGLPRSSAAADVAEERAGDP